MLSSPLNLCTQLLSSSPLGWQPELRMPQPSQAVAGTSAQCAIQQGLSVTLVPTRHGLRGTRAFKSREVVAQLLHISTCADAKRLSDQPAFRSREQEKGAGAMLRPLSCVRRRNDGWRARSHNLAHRTLASHVVGALPVLADVETFTLNLGIDAEPGHRLDDECDNCSADRGPDDRDHHGGDLDHKLLGH